MNSTTDVTQAADRFGTAEKLTEGRIRVRFERHLSHPIERVWAALVDPEQLAKWFPEFTLDPRRGGHFEINFSDYDGSDCEGPVIINGEITHFEPPHLLQCGTMRWELEADGERCILHFSDTVEAGETLGARGTAKSVLGGWHWYLDALEASLAGRFVDRSQPEVDYEPRFDAGW